MNLSINGVIATPVGVMLWITPIGTVRATTIIRQITGIASMVDPTIDTRIKVTCLAGNGTMAGTYNTKTVDRGTRLRATNEVAGRTVEEEIRNGVHCTTGLAKMVRE